MSRCTVPLPRCCYSLVPDQRGCYDAGRLACGASGHRAAGAARLDDGFGAGFSGQTSTDGATWTPIFSTTSGTGGTQTLNVSGTGRYIRMYGTARATQYGYSLWEFQVFSG